MLLCLSKGVNVALFLQNCHLAKSWMPRLEALVEELAAAAASGDIQQLHPNFRLWLTSMPAPYFPVPVLQTGVKVTLEPPKGVRANMLRSFGTLSEANLTACDAGGCGAEYRRLLFVTSFVHAVLQERRKFGPLGWNVPYEFSDADFSCALQTLQMMVSEAACGSHGSAAAAGGQHVRGRLSQMGVRGSGGGQPAQTHIQILQQQQQQRQGLAKAGVPWPALLYILGQITYGGRVTDENDRLLLRCIMQQHLQPGRLGNNVSLTPSGELA
jgi:dynein heavy chain